MNSLEQEYGVKPLLPNDLIIFNEYYIVEENEENDKIIIVMFILKGETTPPTTLTPRAAMRVAMTSFVDYIFAIKNENETAYTNATFMRGNPFTNVFANNDKIKIYDYFEFPPPLK
jgi:hypothetical protein